MKTKKSKINIHNLFYNDRFLIFFSVIAAFAIWVTISMTAGTEIEKTINDVKVNVDLENSVPKQFNLTMFGDTVDTVSVTVKGKRYAVGTLTADDIVVTAQTNYVDSAGKHTLSLKAVPKDEYADFEITSISSTYIEAYFDVYKEATYQLETDIVAEKLMPDGYISEEPILSAKNITICGPATEINKISKVYAKVQVDKPLTTTATINAEIVPVNEYEGTLRYLTVKDDAVVTVTIPILKVKELPVTVDFINTPKNYTAAPLPFSISPSTVKIAAEESYIDKLEKISVGTIDFSDIGALNNKFSFSASSIKEVKFIDGTESFEVSVDASGMVTGNFKIDSSNINVSNLSESIDVDIPSNFSQNIVLVGPSADIAKISNSDIVGTIDVSAVQVYQGVMTFPIDISIKNNNSCWAYGDYKIIVNIKNRAQ